VRSQTPEEIKLVGTIIKTYQRSGKHVVNVSFDPMRMDLEFDEPFDIHLGEKVEISMTVTIIDTKPHIDQPEDSATESA